MGDDPAESFMIPLSLYFYIMLYFNHRPRLNEPNLLSDQAWWIAKEKLDGDLRCGECRLWLGGLLIRRRDSKPAGPVGGRIHGAVLRFFFLL